jgi:hypothetical protein
MNLKKAKHVVELLSLKWGIPDSVFLLELLTVLWISGDSLQEFEFSFIEGEERIRFNHLYLQDYNEEDNFFAERMKKISLAMKMISQENKVKVEEVILLKLLFFAGRNRLFPLQFGLACDVTGKIKIKLYLGINGKDFPLDLFMDTLGFKVENNREVKLDAIALDFAPNEEAALKLYPLSTRDNGTLLRFTKEGKIFSRKVWCRISKGIEMEKFMKKKFIAVPTFLEKEITENKMKVSYLCVENGKKSFYFR